MAHRGAETRQEPKKGDEANRDKDMLSLGEERKVQISTQRWHREEMKQVQKWGDEANRDSDMRRVGGEEGTYILRYNGGAHSGPSCYLLCS